MMDPSILTANRIVINMANMIVPNFLTCAREFRETTSPGF